MNPGELELRSMPPPEGYSRMFAVFSAGHSLGDVLERRTPLVVKTVGQSGKRRRTTARWYVRPPGGDIGRASYPKAGYAARRLLPVRP